MELLSLLAGAALALLITFTLLRTLDRSRRHARVQASLEPVDRVEALCARLTGDPQRDRAVLNQLLALGADIVPALLQILAHALRAGSPVPPDQIARLEELVADFGLSAVPPLTRVLGRLHSTAPFAPSLVRVLRRLGQPGARAVIRRALDHPELSPFLPRFRFVDERTVVDALADEPGDLPRALVCVAGLLSGRPSLVTALWRRWEEPGRAALLAFLADWPPLAPPALVIEALKAPEAALRLGACRIAALLPQASVTEALRAAATDPEPAVRARAVRALSNHPDTGEALRGGLADEEAPVALEAALGLLPERGAGDLLSHTPALRAHPAGALLEAADADADAPCAALIRGLEADDRGLRRAAATLLGGRAAHDPRAKERLVRLASERDGDPVTAVSALARAGDATATELLARVLRSPPTRLDLFTLQEAAQRLGEAAVRPLTRRLRPTPPGCLEATLAVLRVQDYSAATGPLLRGLDDARSGYTEALLASTLHAGGERVHALIDAGLRQPQRGLLAPALRFLAAYAEPSDLPLLLHLFERHPPLRRVILNIVEGLGAAACEPLQAYIAQGGDDSLLDPLEERLALLKATHPG